VAALDEGVGNLERFIAVLADTTAKVQEVNETLETRGEAFDDLESQATDKLSAFAGEIGDFQGQLEASHEEALEDIRGLTAAAREAADSRLTSVEADLDQAESGFEDKAETAREDLDSSRGSLVDTGFRGLVSAIDAAQQELETDGQQVEQSFDALEAGVKAAGDDADSALDEAGEKLSAGTEEARDQVTELAAQAGGAGEGFEQTRGEIEGECTSQESALLELYQGMAEAVTGEAQELTEAAEGMVREILEFLSTATADQLEEPAELVLTDPLPALDTALAALESVIEEADTLIAALSPLVDDLFTAVGVIGKIDELMNAME